MSDDIDDQSFNTNQADDPQTIVEIPLVTLPTISLYYDGLSVEKFDSFDDAIAALATDDFTQKFDNSLIHYGVVVKLQGKAYSLNESEAEMLLTKYGQKRSILLAFESATDGACFINWKAASRNEFLFVEVVKQQGGDDSKIHQFILNFLLNSIKNNHPGCKEEILELIQGKAVKLANEELCDHRDYNLLMSAVESNNIPVINYLIELNFNINDHVKGKTAADIAWDCEHLDVLIQLLKNNSVFPKDFNISSLPDGELKAFASITEEFHQYLHARDKINLKKIINENLNLRHFYNFANNSVINVAIEMKDLELYELLISNNIRIGCNEDFEEIMMNLNDDELHKVRKIHDRYAKVIPEGHVMTLLQHSKFSHDDENVESKTNYILQALLYLNNIPQVSIILMIVAAVKDFTITYDFKHYSVHFVDPTSSKYVLGITYLSGMIYVGAKQFLDYAKQVSAYATLGHELAHFAMDLVYDNLGRPYHKDDKINRDRFEEICKECEKLKKQEEIIDFVYDYNATRWHDELIVRIPHILAEYQGDPNKLEHLLGVFKSLNDYYNDKVVKDMETALPDIQNKAKIKFEKAQRKAEMRKRYNICLSISLVLALAATVCSIFVFTSYYVLPEPVYFWHNLTDKDSASVRNSTINFQGYNVSFRELLGNNSKALDLLSSDQINAMIKKNYLNVGEKFRSNVDFYVEREFIYWCGLDFLAYFVNVTEALEEHKVIILSDVAGSGKTTTYKKLVEKLKNKFRLKWVSFFDLKKHFDVYEAKVKDNDQDWDKEKLVDFIGKDLLRLNESVEFAVFEERFNSDNVIMLFDGVDEISPRYKDFITHFFLNIKELSNNLQRISTRPQYEDVLRSKLNQKNCFSLKPYSKENRVNFLRKFFTFRNLTTDVIEEKIKLFSGKVKDLERNSDELNSPLIIRMLGELLLDSNFFLHLDNKYLLYKAFVNKAFHIASNKGKLVTEDLQNIAQNTKTNMYKIYEHFALKLLMESRANIFTELQIARMTIDQSSEEISRYGIMLLVSVNNFEFIHQTFAEFFVAQYVIDNIFQPDYTPRDEEISERIDLLFYIAEEKETFNVVRDFIADFLSLNKTYKRDEKFTEIAAKEMSSAIDEFLKGACNLSIKLKDFFETLYFIAQTMSGDEQVLKSLWQLDKHENLFIHLTKPHSEIISYDMVLGLAKKHLPGEFTDDKIKNMSTEHAGNIIFNYWLNGGISHYRKVLKLLPKDLKNSNNFSEFFSEMKRILTENQLKLMIQSNVYKMLKRVKAQDIAEFIKIANETLSREEIIQSFKLNCNFYQMENFMTEDYIGNLISAFDQYFDRTIIEAFIKESNFLQYLVRNKNAKVFDKFASFSMKILRKEDIATILNQTELIYDVVQISSIATCECLANFLKEVYASDEGGLRKLLLVKVKGLTMFDRSFLGVQKYRLESFRILARKFPFPIPTELSIFDPTLTFNSNFYSVLEEFVQSKLQNSSELMQAHMHYALKSNVKFKVTVSLPENVTLSELNEAGLLNLTSPEYFSHEIYRSFFLAKILIDKFYNADNDTSADEMENLFHMLNYISETSLYLNIPTLILNYIDSDTTHDKPFPPLIRDKVKSFPFQLIKKTSCDHLLLKLFSKDEELLHILFVRSLISKIWFQHLECTKPVYDTLNVDKVLEPEDTKSRIFRRLLDIRGGRIEGSDLRLRDFKILFPELIEALERKREYVLPSFYWE